MQQNRKMVSSPVRTEKWMQEIRIVLESEGLTENVLITDSRSEKIVFKNEGTLSKIKPSPDSVYERSYFKQNSDGSRSLAWVRMGSLLWLHPKLLQMARVKKILDREKLLGKQVFVFTRTNQVEANLLNFDNRLRYSMVFLSALKELDLKDKTLLDLGAGDGLQSLFARLCGAKKSILVDYQLEGKAEYESWLESNSINFAEDTFHIADISREAEEPGGVKKIHTLMQELGPEGRAEIQIMLANIGAHYGGGETHMAALDQLKLLPQCHTVVIGGYVMDPASRFNPDTAVAKLKELGFSVKKWVYVEDKFTTRILSIIATRP